MIKYTPEEFYTMMLDAKQIGPCVERHEIMDGLMHDLLKALGYEKAMKIFQESEKYYGCDEEYE